MKKIRNVLLLAIVTQSSVAQQHWKSDPEHSRLGFSTTHMLISEVHGIFRDFEINVKAGNPDFSDAVIELTADIGSIDTAVEARDKHLKSPDFFDADNYPALQFKSTAIKETGKNRYRVTGNLSLHDITKQVTVVMVYNGTIMNPRTDKKTAGFQVTGEIKRSDFNIGTEIPDTIVSDEVTIVADMELQLQ